VGDDLEAADHVLIDARMRESGAGDTVTADASSNAAVYGQFFELDDYSTPAFEVTVAIAADTSVTEHGDNVTASELTAIRAVILEADDTLVAAESAFTDTSVTDADDTTTADGVVLTNAYGIVAELGDNTAADGTLGAAGDITGDGSEIESPDTMSGDATCAIAANGDCYEGGDSTEQTVVPAVGGGWSYKRKLRKDEIEELLRREREFARIVALGEPVEKTTVVVVKPDKDQDTGQNPATVAPKSYVAELLAALAKKSTPARGQDAVTSQRSPSPQGEVSAVADALPAPIDDDLVMAAIKHYYGEDVEIIDEPYHPRRSAASAVASLANDEELILEAALHFYYAEAA
jgi:hypothetical protein